MVSFCCTCTILVLGGQKLSGHQMTFPDRFGRAKKVLPYYSAVLVSVHAWSRSMSALSRESPFAYQWFDDQMYDTVNSLAACGHAE